MALIPRDNWFAMEPFFSNLFPSKDRNRDNDFFSPRVDITEQEEYYNIVADLPGVKKDDVNVELHDGILTIEAKTCEESKTEKDKVIRKERRSGFFSRSFNVGKSISTKNINANFEDCVLTLSLQKIPEQEEEKRKVVIN